MSRITRFALFSSIGLTPMLLFQSKLLGQSALNEVLSYDVLRKMFRENANPALLAEMCEDAKTLNSIGFSYFSSKELEKRRKNTLANTIPTLGVWRFGATEYDKEILANRITNIVMEMTKEFCPGIY